MPHSIVGVNERLPLIKWIPLSFQHVFAMFGATVLVPLLTGLNPSAALFTAGSGTLLYILITGAKVPAFLGSSFAFIPALIGIGSAYGMPYALGGAVVAGLFYAVVAGIIKIAGLKWIDRVMPPVVIGSVIIVIGLNLAPVAMGMAMNGADGAYSLVTLSIAAFTLLVAIVATIFFKGFFNVIPILIGLVAGYLFTLVMGAFFPAYALIHFDVVKNAPWLSLPAFAMPKFSLVASLTFVVVSFAPFASTSGTSWLRAASSGPIFTRNPAFTAPSSATESPPHGPRFGEDLPTPPMERTSASWRSLACIPCGSSGAPRSSRSFSLSSRR
jgi:uracil permease